VRQNRSKKTSSEKKNRTRGVKAGRKGPNAAVKKTRGVRERREGEGRGGSMGKEKKRQNKKQEWRKMKKSREEKVKKNPQADWKRDWKDKQIVENGGPGQGRLSKGCPNTT